MQSSQISCKALCYRLPCIHIKEAKKDFTVQAKYVKDGKVLAQSEIETVKVKAGFFAKLKAFFRSLFGKLPKVVQTYLGVEIIERVLP